MKCPMLADTDVMVDFLRGYPKAVALVKNNSSQIILSCVVAAELYAGVRSEREMTALDSLMRLFNIIPISFDLAKAAGLYQRDYARSHGIGLADAIIAATAAAENAEILTLNTKHYPMVKGLKPAYAKA